VDNRGQAPIDKWFVGLFLLFVLVMVWEFFSPIINTTLPTGLTSLSNGNVNTIITNLQGNWYIGMIGLGLGYLFYTIFSPLIGQREDYPI
jgi:predicted small integral membrane protein